MLQEFIINLFRYRSRVGIIIGECSISLMRAYIDGASSVFWLTGDMKACNALSSSWQEYIEKYYGFIPGQGVKGWHRLIKEHSSTEKEAIETFYYLLDAYIRENYPEIHVNVIQ